MGLPSAKAIKMNTSQKLAKHSREIYFGENWTASGFKEHITGITWQQATTKIYTLNTIAALVFHINYYVSRFLKGLEGEPLDTTDSLSFDHPVIISQEDWEKLLLKTLTDAEKFAHAVEQLPESKLEETFVDEKHGSYYRNIQGVIEHSYYHLGQIVIIKKILS